MDKVSIIILTYNSEKTIIKCLNSLKNQTDKRFEVLIVDDDSTDKTLELVNKENKNNKIKIYRNGTHNISIGRNIGLKNSKTQYAAFLDSDAYADRNWIKTIVSTFKENKDVALISGGEIQVFTNNFSKGVAMTDRAINKITSNFWKMRGGNCAIDRVKLNGEYFNEKFKHNDESEFIYRIGKKFKWKYNPKMVIHHESRSTPKMYLRQMYRYGMWRVFFSAYSGQIRLMDFIPSVLVLATLILLYFNYLFILMIPSFSLLGSLFIITYLREKIKFCPYIFLGLITKNIGWGLGVLYGVFKLMTDKNLLKSLTYETKS